MSQEVFILIKNKQIKHMKLTNLTTTPSWAVDNIFDGVFSQVDRFFKDDFWTTFDSLNKNITYPVDTYLDEDNIFFIEIPLAGYKKDNINVEIDGDYLILNVKSHGRRDDVTYQHKGIRRKELSLKWYLNGTFEKDQVESTFQDGLLTISIPFKKETPKPTSYKINIT